MLCLGTVAQVSFLNRVNAGAVILRSEVCREAFFNGKGRGKARWFLLAAFTVLAVSARAADPSVSLAPPPDWVAPLAFQRLSRPEDLNSGLASRLLLSDFQINTRTRETFQHEARQLLTRAGVEDGSHLYIDFDPGHQSLVFHWLRIWRGTNTLNELDLDRVTLNQPERDPDRFLFTGGKTAMLLLEDARPGDIVEYACTIRGEDPAGGGKMSGAVLLRHYEPVEHLATRLLWPRERRLYLKNHGTDTKPTAVRKDDLTEYTWDYKKVPGLPARGLLPGRVRAAALGAMERVSNLVGGQPMGADYLHQRSAPLAGFDPADQGVEASARRGGTGAGGPPVCAGRSRLPWN